MRAKRAFNWLLVLLIPLTFSWKLMAKPPASHEMQGKVIRFLTVHGFGVTEQSRLDGLSIVRATRDDCRIVVAEASPDGSTRDLMRYVAATMDQFFVVFRGDIYDEQPTWLTVTQDWWTRYLHKLGLSAAEAPPIMVAATRSCAAEQLPWAEVSAPASAVLLDFSSPGRELIGKRIHRIDHVGPA